MNSAAFEIVTGYRPGLVGRVTELHALYYTREWNFTAFFETRVATELSEFINRYDDSRDCIWCVLSRGRIEASISIDAIEADSRGAHLRWFIASQSMQGTGLGARLMQLAMAFCRSKSYAKVYLHTFGGLEAARKLYLRHHFKLVDSKTGQQWGSEVEEQTYEAIL